MSPWRITAANWGWNLYGARDTFLIGWESGVTSAPWTNSIPVREEKNKTNCTGYPNIGLFLFSIVLAYIVILYGIVFKLND